jgi:hypothetical protein
MTGFGSMAVAMLLDCGAGQGRSAWFDCDPEHEAAAKILQDRQLARVQGIGRRIFVILTAAGVEAERERRERFGLHDRVLALVRARPRTFRELLDVTGAPVLLLVVATNELAKEGQLGREGVRNDVERCRYVHVPAHVAAGRAEEVS